MRRCPAVANLIGFAIAEVKQFRLGDSRVDGRCRAGIDLQPGARPSGKGTTVGAGLAKGGHLPVTAEVFFAAAAVFEVRAAKCRAVVETDIAGAGETRLPGQPLHQFVQIEILPGAVAVADHRDGQDFPALAFAPLAKPFASVADFDH